MDSAARPYKYQPLPLFWARAVALHPSILWTRAVRLHPAIDAAAPLKCSIENIALHNLGDLEAVSYAWGEPKYSDRLLVDDGSYLCITPSLGILLKAVRLPSSERKLWIDAICINQRDEKEKSYQVQHMAEIYRRAKRVLIWVGESDERSQKLFQAVNNTGNPNSTGSSSSLSFEDENDIRDLVEQSPELISHFFQRSWFERRWVIQELALAKEATMICGKESSDFQHLFGVINYYNIFLPEKCQTPLETLRALSFIQGKEKKPEWDLRAAIFRSLTSFFYAKCSVDHDRIYALMGILNNMYGTGPGGRGPTKRFTFDVDYEEPLVRTYTRFAKLLLVLHDLGPASVLRHAIAIPRQYPARQELPSWVPDWRQPQISKSFVEEWDDLGSQFDAGGRKAAFRVSKKSPSSTHAHLEIDGFMVGQITKRSPAIPDLGLVSADEMKAHITLWCLLFLEYKGRPSIDNLSSRLVEEFVRIITANKENYPIAKNQDSRPSHEALADWILFLKDFCVSWELNYQTILSRISELPSHGDPQLFEELVSQHLITVQDRALFVTDNERMGLCTPNARAGDFVVIFFGFEVPFILRPIVSATQHGTHKQLFELAGECYLHELMDGEAFRVPGYKRRQFMIV